MYARNFERALFLAQIMPPMLTRVQQGGGLTWVVLNVPTTMWIDVGPALPGQVS
jgi:hypothetical protein